MKTNLEQYNDLLGSIEKSSRSDMITIDVRTIDVNWDDNVRRNYNEIDALAESIKLHGLKDPLKVSKVKGEERYILVDGHRRYKAISSLLEQGVPISRVKAMVVTNNPETRLRFFCMRKNMIEYILAQRILMKSLIQLSKNALIVKIGITN